MNNPFSSRRRSPRRSTSTRLVGGERLDPRAMLTTLSGAASIFIDNVGNPPPPDPAPAEIDLELTKHVDNTIPDEGDIIRWTITLTNNADTASAAATGVKVVDTLPQFLTVVGAFPEGASTYHVASGTWTVDQPIEPGESLHLWLDTRVEAGGGAQVLKNVVEVVAADQVDVDSSPNNDDGDQSEDDEAGWVILPLKLSGVGGYVYVDVNNDGIFQDTETPLMGVEVRLDGTDFQGNEVHRTAFTNPDGLYKFNILQPGTYTVTEVQPAQFIDGKDTPGQGGILIGNDQFQVTAQNCHCNAGFNFGERGLKNPSKRMFLASSMDDYWQGLDVSSGDLWYRWTSESSGFLEAVLVQYIPQGDVDIEVFDLQMRQIPTIGDDLHWDVDAGMPYFVRLSGTSSNFDLQLRESGYLVWQKDGLVVVEGSMEDEYVKIELGLTQHTLRIGTQTQRTYNAQTTTAFQVHLGEGFDRLDVVGSTADDLVRVSPGDVRVYGPSYFVWATGAEDQRFVASGGFDRLQMFDSAGDDQLYFHGDWAVMTGNGYMHRADGFEWLDAYSDSGYDVAYFYDTPGNDSFVAYPGYAYQNSGNYVNYARGFDRYNAFGGLGGVDRAELHDSAGDDTYIDRGAYSYLYGEGFLTYVRGYGTVDVRASQGNDVAQVYELDSSHTFYGRKELGVVYGGSRGSRVMRNFDRIRAMSLSGTEPKANIEALDYIFERTGSWKLI